MCFDKICSYVCPDIVKEFNKYDEKPEKYFRKYEGNGSSLNSIINQYCVILLASHFDRRARANKEGGFELRFTWYKQVNLKVSKLLRFIDGEFSVFSDNFKLFKLSF